MNCTRGKKTLNQTTKTSLSKLDRQGPPLSRPQCSKNNKKGERKKGNKEETTTKSNLLKWTVREEKRHWIKQQKPTWNQWKRSYQLDWISILCLATDFACLQFRFSLDMRTGCLKLDWAKIFIESFNIKLL